MDERAQALEALYRRRYGVFRDVLAGVVRDYESAVTADVDRYARFFRGMIVRGVYPPPSQFEAWFPSLAHSDEDIERTIDAAREAFAEVASG